jgi:hypothetical protein
MYLMMQLIHTNEQARSVIATFSARLSKTPSSIAIALRSIPGKEFEMGYCYQRPQSQWRGQVRIFLLSVIDTA